MCSGIYRREPRCQSRMSCHYSPQVDWWTKRHCMVPLQLLIPEGNRIYIVHRKIVNGTFCYGHPINLVADDGV